MKVNNAKVKTLIMHIHQIKWVILNTSDLKHLVTCTSLHVYCPFLIHKNLCLLFWRFHVKFLLWLFSFLSLSALHICLFIFLSILFYSLINPFLSITRLLSFSHWVCMSLLVSVFYPFCSILFSSFILCPSISLTLYILGFWHNSTDV